MDPAGDRAGARVQAKGEPQLDGADRGSGDPRDHQVAVQPDDAPFVDGRAPERRTRRRSRSSRRRPPAVGAPRSIRRIFPRTAPWTAASILTPTRPLASGPDCVIRPLSRPSNVAGSRRHGGLDAPQAHRDRVRPEDRGRCAGPRRPARAGQGRPRYQTIRATGTINAAIPPAARMRTVALAVADTDEDGERDGGDADEPSAAIQPKRASLPVPSECTSASGQDA